MNEPNLREAIDACRPNHDDLRLSELGGLAETLQRDPQWREVFDRSRRFDALLGEAFQDVPVPEGLEARLLATAAGVPGSDLQRAIESPALSAVVPERSPATRVPRGRWKLAVAVLVTVAAGLACAVFFSGPRHRLPQPDNHFAEEVLLWTDEIQEAEWNGDVSADALRAYPLDRAIRALPRRWCWLTTRYDARTLAYDVAPPGREFAYVFCMRARRPSAELPTAPPATPFSTTGGVAIGAWQSPELVYVLAVQGGQRRYQSFLNTGLLIGLGGGPATGGPARS
jgi:hypothetical protein